MIIIIIIVTRRIIRIIMIRVKEFVFIGLQLFYYNSKRPILDFVVFVNPPASEASERSELA